MSRSEGFNPAPEDYTQLPLPEPFPGENDPLADITVKYQRLLDPNDNRAEYTAAVTLSARGIPLYIDRKKISGEVEDTYTLYATAKGMKELENVMADPQIQSMKTITHYQGDGAYSDDKFAQVQALVAQHEWPTPHMANVLLAEALFSAADGESFRASHYRQMVQVGLGGPNHMRDWIDEAQRHSSDYFRRGREYLKEVPHQERFSRWDVDAIVRGAVDRILEPTEEAVAI